MLLILLRLHIFSEKTQEKIVLYLMKVYSEEELNVLLRAISESSSLYEVLCRVVLNMASARGRAVKIKITQEKSKKQESIPQFNQFLAKASKSGKEARKEKELESSQKIKFN